MAQRDTLIPAKGRLPTEWEIIDGEAAVPHQKLRLTVWFGTRQPQTVRGWKGQAGKFVVWARSGTGNFIGRAVASATGAGLLARTLPAPTSGHGKIGGAHNALKFCFPAVGAFHLERFVAAHRQKLEQLIAFQAAEFIDRHGNSSQFIFGDKL
jgi:hypothetical protein